MTISRRKDPRPDAYDVWRNMRRRCSDPTINNFALYGGRGIRVCERWSSFKLFSADMGPRPPGAQIDRIDNDGNYEPGNCRWATRTQQSRNRRTTKFVTWQGETLPVAEWAERLGIPQDTLHHRLESLDVATAFTRPFVGRRKAS